MLSFYLRPSQNRPGHADVYVSIKFSSENRYRKTTGLRVKIANWDEKKMRLKAQAPQAMEVNLALLRIEEKVAEMEYLIKFTNKIADSDMVDEMIFGVSGKSKRNAAGQNLESNFTQYLQNVENTITKNSIKSYRSSFNHVIKYAENKGLKLDYSLFNRDFEVGFTDYLIKEKNISNNTIGKYFMSLKIFLKHMEKRGTKLNPIYKDYRILSAPVDFVYLTSKELDDLLELDLKQRPHLERVRDVFVFQCGSGLRYGDIEKITWDDIHDNRIEITTEKTKQLLRIPLNKYTNWVIERNQGEEKLIDPFQNQVQNRLLKELGAMMGMFGKHKVVKFYGTKRKEDTRAKWELISTHTARRTFVILALERGMRPEVVMKITGHTKLSTLQRYITISDTVVETEMMRAFG
jgi:site-specific recombinase XerD